MNNPFFTNYKLPYDAVPFSKFKTEDFIPAVEKSIELAIDRITNIANNNEKPNFKNTILSLETASEELDYVMSVYWHLFGSESDKDLKDLAEKISPMGSKFQNDILLNSKLFEKIKFVYKNKKNENLDKEDIRLIDVTYKSFIRNGADLNEKDKEKIRKIDGKLSLLSPKFSNNVLNAQNKYELWIDNQEDLEGLPDSLINMAKEEAKQKGKEDKWLFTLQYPSMGPFLNYAKNRELRKELFLAYGGLCNNDEFNNNKIVKEIVQLKHERANLLGYNTFADYVLNDRMAQNIDNVYNLLDDLYDNCYDKAKVELNELKNYAKKIDGIDDFKQWDQSYYSTKLKKEKFNIDPEMLRPYFKAENVINGIFKIANKMYGIKFKELNNVDTWHEEVKCYEVTNNDQSLVGLIYIDLHPRPTKRSGAWMNSIKDNGMYKGEIRRPHVQFTANLTRPTKNKPALLTFGEVETVFHEFGHCLHGLLSDCKYSTIGNTNVKWDFVELPSQIMENWVSEKEALNLFAQHFETDETIPENLIKKIKDSKNFGIATMYLRQLIFGYIDMAWHTKLEPVEDVEKFESEILEKTRLLDKVDNIAISSHFGHIFGGGYAAGYYSYKWAEVLEADAFESFKENGIFDKETALSFRNNILSKGNLKNPMELYKDFKGREPKVDALLKRDGLI